VDPRVVPGPLEDVHPGVDGCRNWPALRLPPQSAELGNSVRRTVALVDVDAILREDRDALQQRVEELEAALLCRKENISKPQSKRIEQESGFPHHLARVLVISQAHKLCVPQMIRIGPLQKLNLRHNLRLDPDALFHLLCC